MYLLQLTDRFTYLIHSIAFILAVIITIYFYAAYKQYLAQMQRDELLDHFLND